MGTFEIIIVVFISCIFLAIMVAAFLAISKTKVFGFENDRQFRRAVHDLYMTFVGYSGIKDYDEYSLTWPLVDYYKWAKRSEKYRQTNPFQKAGGAFSWCVQNGLSNDDFHSTFCLSALEKGAYYCFADDVLNFYYERCVHAACYARSQAGVYLLRFHSEWGKFWKPREKSPKKHYKTIDELQAVKSMCFRSLWERGFFFNDISAQIETAAEEALKKHREIEEKYKYR